MSLARIPPLLLGGLVVVASYAGLGPEVARSDTFVRLGVPELRASAEKAVRARVTAVRSAWNLDRSFVFTYVTLQVLDYYKGGGPALLEVRVPGGTVGGYSVTSAGMPRFGTGDEVVVFLTRWGDGAFKVRGYVQGVSRVLPSPKGPVLRGGTLDGRALADAERELRAGGGKP